MYGIPWVVSPYALWGLRLIQWGEIGAIAILGVGIAIALFANARRTSAINTDLTKRFEQER